MWADLGTEGVMNLAEGQEQDIDGKWTHIVGCRFHCFSLAFLLIEAQSSCYTCILWFTEQPQ